MAGKIELAELFVKLSADAKDLQQGLQGATSKTAKWTEGIKSVAKVGITALTTAAVAAGVAIGGIGIAIGKLAIDAAPLEGIGTAFDAMATKAGLSLDDLRTAAAGTVSDFELMRKANVALTGAGDDLGKAFGENLPALLETARAASRATGQDVGFLFESLVTGVKRSSPMLIDNTGLVLKVGEANAQMAKDLGKAVDELTAEEKQIALLNATVAAGAQMVEDFGGGQVTAAEQIAQFKTQIQNAKDQVGLAFLPALQALLVPLSKLAENVGPQIIEWAKKAGDWLGTNLPLAIKGLTAVFSGQGTLAIMNFGQLISNTFGAEALAKFMAFATPIKNWFRDDLPRVLETAKGFIDKITDGFQILSEVVMAFFSGAPADYPWEDVLPPQLADIAYEVADAFEQFLMVLNSGQGVFAAVVEILDDFLPEETINKIWELHDAFIAAIPIVVQFGKDVVLWLATNIPIAIEAASSFVTDTLIPALKQIGTFIQETVIPAIITLKEWLQTNIPLAIQATSNFITSTLIPTLQKIGTFITETLIPTFINIQTWLQTNIPLAIQTLTTFFQTVLVPGVQSVIDFFGQLSEKFLEVATTAAPGIITAFIAVGSVIWATVQNIATTVIPALQAAFDSIKSAIDTLGIDMETVQAVITNVLTFLGALVSGIAVGIIASINGIITGFANMVANIATALEGLAENVRMFWEGWNLLLEGNLEGLVLIWTSALGIVQSQVQLVFGSILAFIGGFFTGWNTFMQSLIDTLTNVGAAVGTMKDKFVSAFNGIKSAIQPLIDKVQAFADKLKTISLPDWMTPGSPTPLELGLRGIGDAMRRLNQVELPALQAGLTLGVTPTAGIAGRDDRPNINFEMNMQSPASPGMMLHGFEVARSMAG